MKHYGDSSQPDPKSRFMADADSISIDDTPDDVKQHLDGIDLGKKSAAMKPHRVRADVWDVDVVPE